MNVKLFIAMLLVVVITLSGCLFNFQPPASVCGNGNLQSGEQCDDGASNGQVCTASYGSTCTYCSSSCTVVTVTGPRCGDNICNGAETYQSCSSDCSAPSSDRSLLYSMAKTLTWPPVVTNTGFIGAESNPTGNPIGGFYGYNRIVNPNDADYIVHNKDEFMYLFEFYDPNNGRNQRVQPGDIVYIDDNSVIDLTGVWNFYIPANVTIASGRGRGFSKGGLIRNLEQVVDPDDSGRELFWVNGPNVRITGLRIEGPDKSSMRVRHGEIYYQDPPRPDNINGTYYHIGPSIGISAPYPFVEIDNNEIYGWSFAGVAITYTESVNPIQSATNAWVHHNYIHHNNHAGLGYGVLSGWNYPEHPVTSLIEGNLFDSNRHTVASAGTQGNSYEARYNIELGTTSHTTFDRHWTNNVGGDYTIIHHNTDRYAKFNDKGSSGVAYPYVPRGFWVYNNWFGGIIGSLRSNDTIVFNNSHNRMVSPPSGTVLPTPVITIAKDNYKIGEVISFSAAQSTGGNNVLSYACWNFGDRTEEVCDFVNNVKTHSYSKPGRYLVSLKVFDTKGVPMTTYKPLIVHPSNPDAVILSFWIRDSFNEHNTNDSSGYYAKRILVDNQVVWERDVNADGWEWEHVVIDITNYVDDESLVDFQIRSLQNYQRQNYPAYHPFDFFEIYIDDIYIFNRDYSKENFGDWEADWFADGQIFTLEGLVIGDGPMHFYNDDSESSWIGWASYDDEISGLYGYMITSGYRENSIVGSTRGIKQVVKAPKGQHYLDVVNNFGSFRDISSYQIPVNFAGAMDSSNNDVLDFYGYSKRFNGVDNYVSVSNFDLSRDYVLDLNVFLPYNNSNATLMYATNGANYVHIFYASSNRIILKTNVVETTCNLPQLTHNGFNKLVVGRSCNGATCTLSCASNGVVNTFTNPNAVMTLSGTSSVNFGGYASGTTNLFGAIQRARIVKGSIANTVFLDLSKNKLQGAWYFRDGTGSTIQDLSSFNNDVSIPNGITFGTDGFRMFVQFSSGGPPLIIPRNSANIVGEEFSMELIARMDSHNSSFNVVSGTPYEISNNGYSAYLSSRKMFFRLKINQQSAIGDGIYDGHHGARVTYGLDDNRWYHYVFIKSGDYLNVYLDGKIDRKLYVPGYTVDNYVISELLMGYFDGDVTRLAIWDKALTASEIESLYKSSLVACSDSDNDGYGTFPRSGLINGCRLDGFDCNDANAGVGVGGC